METENPLNRVWGRGGVEVNTRDREEVQITDKYRGHSQQFPSRCVTAGSERETSHCRQTCSFTSVCVDRDGILIRILMTHPFAGIQLSVCVTEQESCGGLARALNSHLDLQLSTKSQILLSQEILRVITAAIIHCNIC